MKENSKDSLDICYIWSRLMKEKEIEEKDRGYNLRKLEAERERSHDD